MRLSFDGMHYEFSGGAALNKLGIKGLINTKVSQDDSVVMSALRCNMNKLEQAQVDGVAGAAAAFHALDELGDTLAAKVAVNESRSKKRV